MSARPTRRLLTGTGTWVLLAVLMTWTLAPIAVMVFTSFKAREDVFQVPARLLPSTWTLENYATVFTASTMPQALLNSVVVGVLVALATLVFCFSAGYAMARFRFRSARPLALFILLGQVVPLTVILLPLYQMVTAANLLDSTTGVAFAHLAITVPLVTWMVRNQVAAIPIELEEAVRIDGGSRFDAVSYVTLPVCAPGLVAAGMFAFLQSWHEFLFASVLTTSSDARTAPVTLTEFATEFDVDWGATMAASVVLTVPIVIAFVALQRYFVGGLTGGAVKG
ncbi:carbohydrate ABC transporter permease [Promicromonospora sukumoe]|uniref:ABC-type glycerol-3-phosphate transport system permease component n=1 Tax=Promicromonospora sukumoe TaxID=88382 RepID=A0A7W3J8Q9_9MICO|nr:carbohydrate ABC transporter permease [Promicromonospora sukumoe]MBA8808352.1 ABC-type glycerol-3-phosphate transport system permease component [Promicromonospora sukumoe]